MSNRHDRLLQTGAGRFQYRYDDTEIRPKHLIERHGHTFKEYLDKDNAIEFLESRRDEMYGRRRQGGRRRFRYNPPLPKYDPFASDDELFGKFRELLGELTYKRNPLPNKAKSKEIGMEIANTVIKAASPDEITNQFRDFVDKQRAKTPTGRRYFGIKRLGTTWYVAAFKHLFENSDSPSQEIAYARQLLDLNKLMKDTQGLNEKAIRSQYDDVAFFVDENDQFYPRQASKDAEGNRIAAPYKVTVDGLYEGIRDVGFQYLQALFDQDPSQGYDVESDNLGGKIKGGQAGTSETSSRKAPYKFKAVDTSFSLREPKRQVLEQTEETFEEEAPVRRPTKRTQRRKPQQTKQVTSTDLQAQEVVQFLVQNPELGEKVCQLLDAMRGL